MATRLKTIEYWFDELATVVDNTDTDFTQITAYIPEFSGTVTFKSVVLDVAIMDNQIATWATTLRRQISISVGGAAHTVSNNANVLTASGEQYSIFFNANFTSHFATNWTTGTNKTIDARILIDSNSADPQLRSATAKLTITYEYDDTQSTHIKTAYFPLITPFTALGTTKPGTANDTIPNLSTWLPEAGQTIRQVTLVAQGNEEQAGTTDINISWEVDNLGPYTSQLHEQASNASQWFRHNQIQSFTTNASHSFYIWTNTAAKFAHPQAYLVITYEFTPGSSSTILNSLLLPMEFDSPAGGITSSDPQVATRLLWIEEPTTITIQRSALMLFWEQGAAIAGLNAKIAAGSWNALTSTATTVAGSCAAMIRADSDLGSLTRGKNTLKASLYRTDTTDLMMNISSCWILNYTSTKATAGVGAHNHTVMWNLSTFGTAAAAGEQRITATAPAIPEANYFLTSIGTCFQYQTNTATQSFGVVVQAERLSAEGGVSWDSVYADVGGNDPETGLHVNYATARSVFKRFPGDVEGGARLDLETARRWRCNCGGVGTGWFMLDLIITYHSITYTISGAVNGSAAGTVNIDVFKVENDEKILSTSRVGDGVYSLTWYDNTADLYTVAYEDATHTGRSDDSMAT